MNTVAVARAGKWNFANLRNSQFYAAGRPKFSAINAHFHTTLSEWPKVKAKGRFLNISLCLYPGWVSEHWHEVLLTVEIMKIGEAGSYKSAHATQP